MVRPPFLSSMQKIVEKRIAAAVRDIWVVGEVARAVKCSGRGSPFIAPGAQVVDQRIDLGCCHIRVARAIPLGVEQP